MSNREFRTCEVVCFNKEKIRTLKKRLPQEEDVMTAVSCYKAMGHPARLRLLHVLAIEECCVCDLASILDLPVSTASQHLRVLKTAGLLR